MENQSLFADVILPLHVPQYYTYRVPRGWEQLVKEGQRVVVPFGPKNKLYSALVRHLHHTPPRVYKAKYMESLLDETPVVNDRQFLLWEWISDYYMCYPGEVMNAALPLGLKLSSESRLLLHPDFNKEYESLTDKEYLLAEALELRNTVTIEEAGDILGQKIIYPVIKSLIEKKVVLVEEELKQRYKPKMESYISLSASFHDEEKLKELFSKLEKKAPRQLEVLMAFIHHSKHLNNEEVKRSLLLNTVKDGDAALKSLIKKDVFEISEREEGRLPKYEGEASRQNNLNQEQQLAYEKIKTDFTEKDVVLLHGVTSSGKTEIYVKLIQEAIDDGKQVLYLLPEIALTTQIINRLRKYFGNKINVYHSRFSDNERVEIWNSLLNSELKSHPSSAIHHRSSDIHPPPSVILGARSALFLPFSNLGLVIIDEEHENSYKQYEPAPRYHARDAAIMLARIHNAKTLLGSATPAIETYYNSGTGKYGLATLKQRYGGSQLPEIVIADIKEASRKKLMNSHFSPLLIDNMGEALARKEQVILFQNRRGYAPMVQCSMCGWVPQCSNCDVSLTFHKGRNKLSCHYCGYKQKPPRACEACGNTDLKMKGFGTEKIEDELTLFFPEAKIARMDLDTTRKKNAYQQIISDFESHAIDVLVGTQMVTKGLDFDNVGLVGILSADSMLQFPDFRAYERSYQLMAQVAGRAGRKQKRGRVIIQAFNPGNPVINHVINNDYEAMYREELAERKQYHYPPFYRLIQLTLKHKDRQKVLEGGTRLVQMLKKDFGSRVLGPEFPPVERVRNLYNISILLKMEREASPAKAKELLREALLLFKKMPEYKSVRVVIDVDPV